jgi:hypothetical protein
MISGEKSFHDNHRHVIVLTNRRSFDSGSLRSDMALYLLCYVRLLSLLLKRPSASCRS